jgi:large subunit ribosomal protein L23
MNNINKDKLIKIILRPCVSEKSIAGRVNGQYVFRVQNTATKFQIADAVKLMFGVDVEAVRVVNVRGKTRRFGGVLGQRKDWKKAYVTIKEGQAINLGGA